MTNDVRRSSCPFGGLEPVEGSRASSSAETDVIDVARELATRVGIVSSRWELRRRADGAPIAGGSFPPFPRALRLFGAGTRSRFLRPYRFLARCGCSEPVRGLDSFAR